MTQLKILITLGDECAPSTPVPIAKPASDPFLLELARGVPPEWRCHARYYTGDCTLGYSDVYAFFRNGRGHVLHFWFEEARNLIAEINDVGIARVIDRLNIKYPEEFWKLDLSPEGEEEVKQKMEALGIDPRFLDPDFHPRKLPLRQRIVASFKRTFNLK